MGILKTSFKVDLAEMSEQPRCPSTDKGMNEVWSIHAME